MVRKAHRKHVYRDGGNDANEDDTGRNTESRRTDSRSEVGSYFFLSPLILMVLYLTNNENFNEITAVPTKEVAGGKRGQQLGEFCLTI